MPSPEEKYGQKIEYDPLWKGPMKIMRFLTDRIWLIVFVLFLILYIFTATFGFKSGNISAALAPVDSAGRICGYDPDVENKSYLLNLNLKYCSNEFDTCTGETACVSECPTENFLFSEIRNKPLPEVKEKIICTTNINMTSITSIEQIDILVKHGECTPFYLVSESIRYRCFPKNTWPGHENQTLSAEELKIVKKAILGDYEILKSVINDSKEVLSPIVMTIFAGLIIAIGSVILLRWFAVPFFYSSIVMFCGFAIFGIYRITVSYVQNHNSNSLLGLILCIILLVAIILAVIHFRKKVYLACLLIKESSKAVQHLPSTLLFPIIPWILYILIVVIAVSVFLVLNTITIPVYELDKLDNAQSEDCQCEDYPDTLLHLGFPCDPSTFNSKCKTPSGNLCVFFQCRLQDRISPPFVSYFHAINFIGVYWILFFISGFEYMVLGGTFASWYWTFNKNSIGNFALLESMGRTTRFHLGSIAIGSLILTISQIIKLLIQGLQKKFSSGCNTLGYSFKFIYDLIDSFLTFLNYNAYIMCAIHGKSFIQSAKSAFKLVMRNMVKVIVVNTVADMLFIMVKILITTVTVTGLIIWYSISHPELINTEENSGPFVAAIVLSIIGTYLIISVIFSVQSVAVDTIFLCFIEDSERNDGSEDRPYYMSDKLKQLLHK